MSTKKSTPNYLTILNTLYYMTSLIALGIFFFGSLTEDFEPIAMWGTILAAFLAVVILTGSVIQMRKYKNE